MRNTVHLVLLNQIVHLFFQFCVFVRQRRVQVQKTSFILSSKPYTLLLTSLQTEFIILGLNHLFVHLLSIISIFQHHLNLSQLFHLLLHSYLFHQTLILLSQSAYFASPARESAPPTITFIQTRLQYTSSSHPTLLPNHSTLQHPSSPPQSSLPSSCSLRSVTTTHHSITPPPPGST